MSDSAYRQPILALILRVVGLPAAAIALIPLGVIIFGVVSGKGAVSFSLSLPVLVSALATLFSALLLLGVAQVIDYLGRTAHASEAAADSAEDSADLLRQLLRAYGYEPEE